MRFVRHGLALTAALALAAPAFAADPAPVAAAKPAVDPAAIGYARTIVAAAMPPAHRPEMVRRLVEGLVAPMRGALTGAAADPGLRQIVDEHITRLTGRLRPIAEQQIPLVMEATAQAYVRAFPVAELEKISQFAQSPAGAHYLSQGPAIAADPAVTSANQAFLAEAAIIGRSSGEELRTAISDYLGKHPDVAQKLQQQARERQQAQQPAKKRP